MGDEVNCSAGSIGSDPCPAAPGNGPKVVALTGCTRGIGKALLEWFSAQDMRVAGCGTSESELKEIQRDFPFSKVCRVDVCDESAVSAWASQVVADLGPIDLLVCNAGVLPKPQPLWEIPADDWQQACNVNVLGTARVLRHMVPRLRVPGAIVVLVSSRYGRSVVKGQGAYAATKWATEALAKTLALELEERGVTVVSLDPGVVNTDMLRSCGADPVWCNEQQSAAEFAAQAGPLLVSLGLADTGRNLTCPGSPEHYFQTGLPYKDRPAWANGFGPFIPAREDLPHESAEDVGDCTAKRQCTAKDKEVSLPSS